MAVEVWPEPTPNPNAVKFSLNRQVIEKGSKTVDSADKAQGDPLAEKLISIEGVTSLFFLNNFITVTRRPDADWNSIVPVVQEAIQAHYS